MYATHQKEQFNIAFVGSLAAQAGANSSKLTVDNDSVDITFSGTGFDGLFYNPHIDFQLKCTHAPNISNGIIKFSLKRKNYDDLRAENVIHPKYLAILIVPEQCGDWTEHLDTGLLLKGHCYWASIKAAPAVATQSVTVNIPLSQSLTSKTVTDLLEAASRGVDP